MSFEFNNKKYPGMQEFIPSFNEEVKKEITVPDYAVGNERELSELLYEKIDSKPIELIKLISTAIENNKKSGEFIESSVLSFAEEKSMYQAALQAIKMLNINASPTLYSYNPKTLNYVYQLIALGFCGNINIFISSQMREENMLTFDEKKFLLGHELGHQQCNHIMLAFYDSRNMYMSRLHEYSSDRAGLIASQNLRGSAAALLKIMLASEALELSQTEGSHVRVNWESYDANALDIQLDELLNNPVSSLDSIASDESTHPHLNRRIAALEAFSESELYYRLSNLEQDRELLSNAQLNKRMQSIIT